MTESQIFSRLARSIWVNKHFIIWPLCAENFLTLFQPKAGLFLFFFFESDRLTSTHPTPHKLPFIMVSMALRVRAIRSYDRNFHLTGNEMKAKKWLQRYQAEVQFTLKRRIFLRPHSLAGHHCGSIFLLNLYILKLACTFSKPFSMYFI